MKQDLNNEIGVLPVILGVMGGFIGYEISDGLYSIIFGFLCLVIGMVLGVLVDANAKDKIKNAKRKKTRESYEKEHKAQLKYFRVTIDIHIATLARKRHQLITTSDYGIVDDKLWKQEVCEFSNTVFVETPGAKLRLSPNELGELVDKQVKEYQLLHGEKIHLNFDEDMTGLEYEHFCADLLKKNGWDAKVTKGSGDQGVDVVAKKNGKIYAIQCKKYSSPVGNKAVQEAHAGKGFINADNAAVVTNASFTRSANELSNTLGILLLHHADLERLNDTI